MKYSLVYVTAGSKEEAEKIGAALVEERLAACVNIYPIKSIYRWKGKVEKAEEVAILVKTRTDLVDKLITKLEGLHSYEVPDIVALPITKGYPRYLDWISESTE
jgi:periplasmic divalent cation tolerance protein